MAIPFLEIDLRQLLGFILIARTSRGYHQAMGGPLK